MASRIEDYALIGDLHTAALIDRGGTLAWLPLPRFDSNAAFAALLGDLANGHWTLAPAGVATSTRRYDGETLILETTFTAESGVVRTIDFMPVGGATRRVIRHVVGERGRVAMRSTFAPKFDYGEMAPWVVREPDQMRAICGPDALVLRAPVPLVRDESAIVAAFDIGAGETIRFEMAWYPSYLPVPAACESDALLTATRTWWLDFVAGTTYRGRYRDAVVRSLITLKALTYEPTGAIVAAPTTSLPEHIGGVRNWDYRYCWLRDATFTLIALLNAGCSSEAQAFIGWLVRAVAGDADKVRILYGVAGERFLPEHEIAHLAGFAGSRPVRIGNDASTQFQRDVFGEVIDAIYASTKAGLVVDEAAWQMVRGIVDHLIATEDDESDRGIWEVRGEPQAFTYSKVMAWVAFDRAVKLVQEHGYPGDVVAYGEHRDRLHAEILARGYDATRGAFTQSYGSAALDASALLIASVGFLPPDDPRIGSTVDAIARELGTGPFVRRYVTAGDTDGLPPGEGAFLACSFWLADAYSITGREDAARALFEQLLTLRNDVGLLSEEVDPRDGSLLGNFPQAFSHLGLITTALNLERRAGPAAQRAELGSAVDGGEHQLADAG